jgi:hypothetical protein
MHRQNTRTSFSNLTCLPRSILPLELVQETLGNRGNTSRFLYGLSKHEQLPYVLSSADNIPEKLRDWSNLYLSATYRVVLRRYRGNHLSIASYSGLLAVDLITRKQPSHLILMTYHLNRMLRSTGPVNRHACSIFKL